MGKFGFASIQKENFPDELIDKQRWFRLVGQIPELRPIDVLHLQNPFTGERISVQVDGAELIRDGQREGVFLWEKGEIFVDGPESMLPWAQRIARALGARVFDDIGDEFFEE
jgi:hypothetical protein